MSVNSIGPLNGMITGLGNELTEETKRKLIALGIDPSTVTSEAQAKVLIENAVRMQIAQGIEPKVKCSCCSTKELISKAKKLAIKTGVKVNEEMTLEQLLEIARKNIEIKKNEDLRKEYLSLKEESSKTEKSESDMFEYMNYGANLNKMNFGL